jgi:adenylate cyclase
VPGSVEITIVFIDLASFTERTETEGDQAAIDILGRFYSVVRGLALDHDGKLVKQIGDELMLAFRRPDDAVAFAEDLDQAASRDASLPPLHTGIHTGSAIYRAGDYIGTTVNVAARVTTEASAGETLLTEAVAERMSDGPRLESAGARTLRGVEQPLRLFRLPRQEGSRG